MNRPERTEYIYALLDGNKRIFYCGRSRDINKRLKEHIEEAMAGGQSRKCRHIRELIERGDVITVTQIDEAPASKIAELEAWWINKLDWNVEDLGYTVLLYNGNSGSQGNVINEAQVRNDVQEWKRNRKSAAKRKGVPEKKWVRPTEEQKQAREAERARLSHLYATDRARYNREYAAHKELMRDREKLA